MRSKAVSGRGGLLILYVPLMQHFGSQGRNSQASWRSFYRVESSIIHHHPTCPLRTKTHPTSLQVHVRCRADLLCG